METWEIAKKKKKTWHSPILGAKDWEHKNDGAEGCEVVLTGICDNRFDWNISTPRFDSYSIIPPFQSPVLWDPGTTGRCHCQLAALLLMPSFVACHDSVYHDKSTTKRPEAKPLQVDNIHTGHT